jgi:ribonuclease HII
MVAGADEVGRGAFAGPVVAGIVAFGPNNGNLLAIVKKNKNLIINDSKKLSDSKRRIADGWIRQNCLTWGVGEASVTEINKLGISKATSSAFRRAIAYANNRLQKRIDYLLVDAFFIPFTRHLPIGKKQPQYFNKTKIFQNSVRNRQCQTAIIKGDEKCFSIAAASIVAKVYRDDLMIRLSQNYKYKKYSWDKNKGYGTRLHINSLKENGSTKYHRIKFVSKYV